MDIDNISEISDEYIRFLKENGFILEDLPNLSNSSENYLRSLLIRTSELYSEFNTFEFNQDGDIKENNINLIGTLDRPFDKDKQHQKTIFVLKNLLETNKNEFDDLLLKSSMNKQQKKELIDLLYNCDPNDSCDHIYEWVNYNGIQLLQNLNRYFLNGFYKDGFNIFEPKDLYNSFTSLDILSDIENNFSSISKYILKHGKYEVISTYYYGKISLNRKLIKSINIRALIWLVLNKGKEIEFNVWLSAIKKKLSNSENLILGPKQVNTGCTYRGDCKSILLWRDEEIKKVLIHEMGHCLKIEFGESYNSSKTQLEYDTLVNSTFKFFRINDDISIKLYESYNEMWALIMNLFYCSIEYKISKGNKEKKLYDVFSYFLKMETCFSLFQVAKILNYFDFSKFNDLCNVKGFTNEERKNSKFRQSSSIISYYIIKSSLLFNFDKFVSFCLENNSGDHEYIKFNENTFKTFGNLIKTCLLDKDFENKINNFILKIKNLDKRKKIYKSMRMTIIDI